jgi:hypothetical protein
VRLTSRQIAASEDRQQLCFTFWFTAFGSGESAELHIIRQDNSTSEEENKKVRFICVLKREIMNFRCILLAVGDGSKDDGHDSSDMASGPGVRGHFH